MFSSVPFAISCRFTQSVTAADQHCMQGSELPQTHLVTIPVDSLTPSTESKHQSLHFPEL